MSVPILNDGKIYVVTAPDGHLGDFRTFAEALVCAREHGAIGGVDREYSGTTLNSAHYSTPDGGLITIAVELVDPLLRGKYMNWDDPVSFTTTEITTLLVFVRAGADRARQRVAAHFAAHTRHGGAKNAARWGARLRQMEIIEAKLQKLLPATLTPFKKEVEERVEALLNHPDPAVRLGAEVILGKRGGV